MPPSLGEWLTANGLSEFQQVFVDNQVDLTVLPLLTEADLKELGLPLGPRRSDLMFNSFISRWWSSCAVGRTGAGSGRFRVSCPFAGSYRFGASPPVSDRR